MSTINRLSSVDVLQPSDQIPVWDSSNGDTRKASMSTLLAFVESYFADPDYSTRIVAPNTDYFTVDIGNTGDSIWMIVNPVLNFTTGAITLPSTAYAVNDQEITVVFTAAVINFSITSSGATVLGAPVSINGYDSFRVRYNASQQTWYTLDTTGDGAGGVSQITRQDFTGNGTTTTFTLTTAPSALGNELQIFIDGVYQERSGYAVTGSNVVFSEAPPSLSTIEVLGWSVTPGVETSANLVSYTPVGTGAVVTSVEAKLRESVSVLDFGADPTGTSDSQSAIQAAINTGGPVYLPTGKYKVSSTLKLNNNGQKFFGDGQAYGEKDVGSVLIWTGTTGNFFEINSGRRDSSNLNLVVKGIQLQDIQLFQEANGSAVSECMLWIENGCFDCKVDNISIWIEGLVPTQAAMKVGSDDTSYTNGCHFSRIYIRPANLDATAAAPIPKGLWVLGAIESSFSEISVYDVQKAYVFGGTTSEYRNLESCTFEKLHCEVGDRDYATVGGVALEFWAGSDLTFYGCKFQMPTSDSNTGFENFRGVKFLGNTVDSLERLKFISCRFGGNQNADYAIKDESDGRFVSAYFTDCTFAEFSQGIVDAPFPTTSQILFNNLELYRTRSDINRNLTFSARGYESGALNIVTKDADNYTLENFPNWSRRGLYLGSVTHPNGQPVLFTGVQSIAGAYSFEANLFNAGTGTAITSADNVVRVRPMDDTEIISQTIKPYASGAIGDGAVYNESVTVSGVIVGDHIVCGYIDDRATGAGSSVLNGLIFSAQATANNTVDFQILNETGASRTPPTGRMIVAKVGMQFDIVHVENYDAPSIADGAYLITDVTVTGANIGDYVSVAPLTNTQNIFLSAAVKADNTVSLIFYNATGGAIDLAAINYVIGIIHQPTTA